MKKLLLMTMIAMMGISLFAPAYSFYTKVPAGYVGVKVKLVGSERGVNDIKIVTGRVFYNPIVFEVHKFPTFIQSVAWTKNKSEGSNNNEEISFETKGGLVIYADVNLNLTFDPDKVPSIFKKFRKQPEAIVDGYLRQQIRNTFVEIASTYTISNLIENKKQFIKEVNDACKVKFSEQGFIIDYVGLIGNPRYPEAIVKSINDKIKATQEAQMKQREVETAKAEAQKVRETAKGSADAILINARAQARANTILNASLTPALVKIKAIEKWNGVQPTVVGSDGLILNLGNTVK